MRSSRTKRGETTSFCFETVSRTFFYPLFKTKRTGHQAVMAMPKLHNAAMRQQA
jgi:hypothetical protein